MKCSMGGKAEIVYSLNEGYIPAGPSPLKHFNSEMDLIFTNLVYCELIFPKGTFFRVTIFRVFELTPWAFLRERVLCRWRVSALEVSNKIRHFSPTNRLAFLHEILLIAGQLAQQCPAVVLVAWLAVTIRKWEFEKCEFDPSPA